MNRRTLIATTALALAVVPLRTVLAQSADPADTALVARVEVYLNGLRSLKARFLQVAPNGAVTQGLAWLERPGRMRFQYDAPSPLLLVAGHGLVVFHDAELDQTSNVPLGQTPLGILLADTIKLSGDVTLLGLRRAPGVVEVTVTRTASPGEGQLTLIFADPPLALRGWIVTDAQRQKTRVTLSDVTLGGHFESKLFEFVDPKFFRNGGGGQVGGG